MQEKLENVIHFRAELHKHKYLFVVRLISAGYKQGSQKRPYWQQNAIMFFSLGRPIAKHQLSAGLFYGRSYSKGEENSVASSNFRIEATTKKFNWYFVCSDWFLVAGLSNMKDKR